MQNLPITAVHGHRGSPKWPLPQLVAACSAPNRKDQNNNTPSNEYLDTPEVLQQKMELIAQLLTKSKYTVAYTGAGLSRSSGIPDYATQAPNSVVQAPRIHNPLDALPTFAHHILTALQRQHLLHAYVQQNHDGLPQKAGFPQMAINEIHGAWFDPSNPVVPMEGSLRGDLFAWMKVEEKAADLVLALGSSLCGMNADRMVTTAGRKGLEGRGLGSVIVGFQQTKLDEYASLRIFAKIDEVMLLLALELGLSVPLKHYVPSIPPEAYSDYKADAFIVPYNKDGLRSKTKKTIWNLSPGARLKLTAGPGKGFEGEVVRTPTSEKDFYLVAFPCTREGPELGKGFGHYALGTWFVEAAAKGQLDFLPCINI